VTYDGPWIEKGFVRVSEKPGIGVDINEDAMRKYAVPNVPFLA
jgi:galactonate dehydratase